MSHSSRKRREARRVAKQHLPTVHTPPSQSPTGQQGRRVAVGIKQSMHAGPLPDAETLQGYEAACPGAADRVITMAEEQARHRQSLEAEVVKGNGANEKRGQYLGFIVAIFFGGGSIFLIYTGKQASGLISMAATIAALVGTFILGRRGGHGPTG